MFSFGFRAELRFGSGGGKQLMVVWLCCSVAVGLCGVHWLPCLCGVMLCGCVAVYLLGFGIVVVVAPCVSIRVAEIRYWVDF